MKNFTIVSILANVLFASYVAYDILRPAQYNHNQIERITSPVKKSGVTYRLILNVEQNNDDNTISVLSSHVLVDIGSESVAFNELEN